MFAMHVEHKDWTFWEEYTVASKFRGKYIACYPIGITHLVIHNTGMYTCSVTVNCLVISMYKREKKKQGKPQIHVHCISIPFVLYNMHNDIYMYMLYMHVHTCM